MIRSRRLLPKTIGKIRRKASLRILGFGDSVTAIQSNTPSTGILNGTLRDRGTAPLTDPNHYLRDAYGADVVDAIPLYTSVQLGRADDGGGAVHTKIGWNWELVAALVASGYVLGTDLFYDNNGVGGLSSANAVVGGVPQAWLTFAAAQGADLAVVALGMNERGSALTEANMIVIANTFRTAGIEVLFIDCPRPRAAISGATLTNWQYTNRAIRRAAEYSNSAHLSLTGVYDARYIQACGIHITDA
jgi:lysophospholipase L1-like esterase